MPGHARCQAATAGDSARELARRAFHPRGTRPLRRPPAKVGRPVIQVANARPAAPSRRRARHLVTLPIAIR